MKSPNVALKANILHVRQNESLHLESPRPHPFFSLLINSTLKFLMLKLFFDWSSLDLFFFYLNLKKHMIFGCVLE